MAGPARGAGGGADRARSAPDPLAPYVPHLVLDWLADEPDRPHRCEPGTLLFADISGFTSLTERLATRGKVGAEEMGALLNRAFDELLTAAYDVGANLIKWGGDAVLLLFEGADHPVRAARAAWGMQQVMRRIGRLPTSRGVVRLGISIGIHSADVDFLLVGTRHRELVVTGPAATAVTRMEKVAERGQTVLSPDTARRLPARCVGAARGDGFLLAAAPLVEVTPNRTPKRTDVDIGPSMCVGLRDHLRGGQVEDEHRNATIGFIEFSGTDELRRDGGPQALVEAVENVIGAAQAAAEDNHVTFLATDLAENGGKIILTAGVPHSPGDDATRVLSTVRRMIQPGGPLTLRAGVTCGSVFAGDYGPVYRKTYSIAGDVVNLAARLMSSAGPGQVLATPAVVKQSRTDFETSPLPPFAVKGKGELVEAVLVGDRRRGAQPEAGERGRLIGRDPERAQLIEALHRAGAGRGGVVDIVGVPGMGKSRLVEDLAAAADTRILWADGDIYGRSTPYQPMQRLLRHTLGLAPDVSNEIMAATLTDLVHARAPDLAPWLPLIAIVAGVAIDPTPEVERLDPGVRRQRLEIVTSDLLGRLLPTPLLMIVNDVHFMDEATLGFVRRLVADVGKRPWLIVLTRRPTVEAPVPPEQPVVTLPLGPLSEDAAAEVVAVATETNPMSERRAHALAERAGGNPLFLTQLVAAAAHGADLEDLPHSIEGTIAAQLDRLPPQRRRWLRAASVLGMTVDPGVLRAMLVGTDLEDETWLGLDDFIAVDSRGQLRFAHHLVRLTAYEGLPFRRRTELHARAAAVLEQSGPGAASPALLSLHCLNGEQFAQAWTLSRAAGDQARAQYAAAEAAENYRRALTAAERVGTIANEDVADVLEALAGVYLDLGEMPQAEGALRSARGRATGDPVRLARLHLTTARQRQHTGRHTAALRWVAGGRALVRSAADPASRRLLAELAERGAGIRYDQGAYGAALTWARRCVREARAVGDPTIEARGLGLAAACAAAGGGVWEQAVAAEALDRFQSQGDLRNRSRVANLLGVAAYFAGRWDDAVELYGQAERDARLIGRDFDAAATAANQAEILVQQGRLDEAEPRLRAAIRVLLPAQATSFLGFATMLYGRVALGRGDVETAMERLAAARGMALEMGEVDESIAIDALVAECYLRAGDTGRALDQVESTLARTRAAGAAPSALPRLQRIHGEALIAGQRTAAGRAALRESLATARKHGASNDVEAALRSLLAHSVAEDEGEASAWAAERAEVATRLGIIA